MIDPTTAYREAAEWQRRFAQAAGESLGITDATDGATPREAVWRAGGATLYHYPPAKVTATPVLIVYSLVNRPFILDLTEERSLVRALRDAGHPVYLLDWGDPAGADRFLELDDYIGDFLRGAARRVAEIHGAPPDLLGVCQGGVFSLCLAALEPSLVRRLITLVTPVDFHTPADTLGRLARKMDFDSVADAFGNVPAAWLNTVFISLKPYRLLSQRYMDLPELAGDPVALADFLRMEHWMYGGPDQAGTAFAQFAKRFYQENALVGDGVELCGQRVTLTAVQAPVLTIFALNDHLVPPAAARALSRHIPSERYREHAFDGGHLGVFVSRRARREIFPKLTAWLAD